MPLNKFRRTLSKTDLNSFDRVLSNYKMADNVTHYVTSYKDTGNFSIQSVFEGPGPKNALTTFNNGKITDSICY